MNPFILIFRLKTLKDCPMPNKYNLTYNDTVYNLHGPSLISNKCLSWTTSYNYNYYL